jgi:hypothetical protein
VLDRTELSWFIKQTGAGGTLTGFGTPKQRALIELLLVLERVRMLGKVVLVLLVQLPLPSSLGQLVLQLYRGK